MYNSPNQQTQKHFQGVFVVCKDNCFELWSGQSKIQNSLHLFTFTLSNCLDETENHPPHWEYEVQAINLLLGLTVPTSI